MAPSRIAAALQRRRWASRRQPAGGGGAVAWRAGSVSPLAVRPAPRTGDPGRLEVWPCGSVLACRTEGITLSPLCRVAARVGGSWPGRHFYHSAGGRRWLSCRLTNEGAGLRDRVVLQPLRWGFSARGAGCGSGTCRSLRVIPGIMVTLMAGAQDGCRISDPMNNNCKTFYRC